MKFIMYILSMILTTVLVVAVGSYTAGVEEWTPIITAKGLGLWILFWASIDFHVFVKNKLRG